MRMPAWLIGIVVAILFVGIAAAQQQTEPEKGVALLSASKDGNGTGLIVSSPPGIECGDGGSSCSASFVFGTPVTLTAQPIARDSVFEAWSAGVGSAVNCTAAKSDCSFILAEDSSIKGTFVSHVSRTFALTVIRKGEGEGAVISQPAGIECGDGKHDCSARFPAETVVTLQAIPAAGSVLEHWSDAAGSAIPCNNSIENCTVTLNEESGITATFVRSDH